MRIFRRGWRAGWPGRLLRIHSRSAHFYEECWCRGTKHEISPKMLTGPKLMKDLQRDILALQALSLHLHMRMSESFPIPPCSDPNCKECSESSGNGQSALG